MAKIVTQKVRRVGDTPKLTMPKDMLARHKLVGNSDKPVEIYHSRNTKLVKRLAEGIKHYRQNVHGVNERKLAAPFRNSANYFAIPLTRADSDNPRDRKGLDNATATEPAGVETETLT